MAQMSAAEDIGRFTHCFRAEGFGGKQTCKQCRSRKVRCDGNLEGCSHCTRLNFDCSFKSPQSTASTTLASSKARDSLGSGSDEVSRPPKRRVTRACVPCRQQKIRCSGNLPRCTNCMRRKLQCQYAVSKRPLRDPSEQDSPTGGQASRAVFAPWKPPTDSSCACREAIRTVLQDGGDSSSQRSASVATLQLKQDIEEKIEDFFEKLYPLPSFTFLHPATVKSRLSAGTLDKALALSLYALSDLHLRSGIDGGTQPCACRGYTWIQEAENILWQQLERPTISRLQAILLIILYRMETGHFQRAFMLTGLASRSAIAMRLTHARPDLPSIARETRTRILWVLKLAERYFSIGVLEAPPPGPRMSLVPLPCCEEEFGSVGIDGLPLGNLGDSGTYRLLIENDVIRGHINHMARQLAESVDPLCVLNDRIEEFEIELERVGSRLIPGPDLTNAKLGTLLDSRWLARHILLHLSWHHTHCDLYRMFLAGFPEAAPKVVIDALEPARLARAESLCQDHAVAIIQILTSLNQLCTASLSLEFDTAICAYHATRLILFISRFGRQTNRYSPEFAVSRADLCLAALRRFFPTSSLVRPIVSELERMVRVFSSHTDAAPQPQDAAQGRPSPTAQKGDPRQRLAIHSLLRQADFSDDEEDSSPATTADMPLAQLSRQQDHSQAGRGGIPPGAAAAAAVDGPVGDSITVLGDGGRQESFADGIGSGGLRSGDTAPSSYDLELGATMTGWDEFDILSPDQNDFVQYPMFPWVGWHGPGQDQDWTYGGGL